MGQGEVATIRAVAVEQMEGAKNMVKHDTVWLTATDVLRFDPSDRSLSLPSPSGLGGWRWCYALAREEQRMQGTRALVKGHRSVGCLPDNKEGKEVAS